ncbi:MAG TPA: hypothetical protein VF681_09670 [Abditibacteriaceae bacterium]|jgi:predicted RNA-binding Zn-ribbon protein involved in translation (DUF1610 family)
MNARRDVWAEKLGGSPATGKWLLRDQFVVFRCPHCETDMQWTRLLGEIDLEVNVVCPHCDKVLENVVLEMYGDPPA